MFPDEFHLNTLDQLLSAITRLNPHVNVKSIVIGLMDRLSSYASRESESEAPDDRQQNEQEAVARLLKELRISNDAKQETTEKQQTAPEQLDGDRVDGETEEGVSKGYGDEQATDSDQPLTNGAPKLPRKNRGIPDDIKLYEVFYSQVTNLVNAQRLHIHDTIALIVSLANLTL